jgi:hypothetical protein
MILRNGKLSGKNIEENFPYGKIFHLTSVGLRAGLDGDTT